MPDNTFNTILDLLENITQLPLGSIRALTNFDLRPVIEAKIRLSKKDTACVVGFVPAVLQRAADLGVTVGIQIGLKQALEEGLDSTNIAVTNGEEFNRLVKEAAAVANVFFDQARSISFGDFDPFKDERQIVRTFAKKNGLNADYQTLLGVSDGTPDEYPASFVEKYLS